VGQATNITLLVFMMCLCSGVILLTIGILGVYLSRIFAASRQRPLYIVANTVGFNKTAAITWHHSTHNEIRKRG
jgi:dolichol-phosphate mannosyltransferase